jgi:ribosome-associated protein
MESEATPQLQNRKVKLTQHFHPAVFRNYHRPSRLHSTKHSLKCVSSKQPRSSDTANNSVDDNNWAQCPKGYDEKMSVDEPNKARLAGELDLEIDGDDEERTRGSLKRERVANELALAQLVQDLLPLSEEKWRKVGVSEITMDALIDSRKIKSHAARGRHARLIRSTLRDGDWSLVRRRLDHLRAGFTLGSPEGETSSPGQIWTEQLLVQGDAGLARFCEAYPKCDRKRLRQLTRGALSVPENKRGKARLQLERAVETEVRRHQTNQTESEASSADL